MGVLNEPYWLIGISVSPFDVHKNAAPISGEIVLNKHFNGKYYNQEKKQMKMNETQ